MRLEKYHALGNDFLIVLDVDGRHPIDEATARALCDRHRGVGADGVIRATRGRNGAQFTMELRNADGGIAETSGNGLRCLGAAAVAAGLVDGPDIAVLTDAGPRRVTVPADGAHPSTEMGTAKFDVLTDGPAERSAYVDIGNPHLVVHDGEGRVDGAALARRHPDVNVEVVDVRGATADTITMRVWERGVGETQSCGTGACAAAYAAREWGLVGDRVTVHQPGGDLVVELDGEQVVLIGPVEHVCTVEVDDTRWR